MGNQLGTSPIPEGLLVIDLQEEEKDRQNCAWGLPSSCADLEEYTDDESEWPTLATVVTASDADGSFFAKRRIPKSSLLVANACIQGGHDNISCINVRQRAHAIKVSTFDEPPVIFEVVLLLWQEHSTGRRDLISGFNSATLGQ
eukprot:scaffold10127_cov103-Cylindrotheca_fusiformis.AAC.1